MRQVLLAIVLLLAACDRDASPQVPTAAGARLEAAARAAGLVEDAATVDATGVYRSDTDSACAIPAGDGYRIAAMVDYGPGQGCIARGTATGRSPLSMSLGDGCMFEARLDDGRMTFPATLPEACARFCTGRASLAALTAERLSRSVSEAGAMRAADGSRPCGTD